MERRFSEPPLNEALFLGDEDDHLHARWREIVLFGFGGRIDAEPDGTLTSETASAPVRVKRVSTAASRPTRKRFSTFEPRFRISG